MSSARRVVTCGKYCGSRLISAKGSFNWSVQCYGAEPPTVEEEYGRINYTQYEALYARKRDKKTWYLFIDESFPIDEHKPEPEELRELQAAYLRKLQSDTHVYHSLTTAEGLEASVLKLRDDLTRLRRGVKQWALTIVALLLLIVALVMWQLRSQAEIKGEMAKLRQGIMEYAQKDAQVRGAKTETDPAAMQEQSTPSWANSSAWTRKPCVTSFRNWPAN